MARGSKTTVTFAGRDEVSEVITKLEGKIGKLQRQIKESGSRATKASSGIGKMGGRIIALNQAMQLATAGARLFRQAVAESVGEFLKFDKAMAEVSTLVDKSASLNAELAGQVKEVSREFGGDLPTNARALYQIISSGAAAGEDSQKLLNAAMKLSVGGITDAATASDGLTTIINSWGLSASRATEVSDAMFSTMRQGKTTIGEISSGIGKTSSAAAALGVSFQDTLAGMAALTLKGVSTDEAFTGLNAIFTAVLKKQETAAQMGPKVAEAFSLQSLATKDFDTFLVDVVDSLGGSEEALVKLTGRVEGAKAIMALTSDGGQKFSDVLDGVTNSAGETEEAVGKITNTLSHQAELFKSLSSQAAESFGALLAGGQDTISIFKLMNETLQDVASSLEKAGFELGLRSNDVEELRRIMRSFTVAALESVSTFGELATIFLQVAEALRAVVNLLTIAMDSVQAIGAALTLNFDVVGDIADRIRGDMDDVSGAVDNIGRLGKIGDNFSDAMREASDHFDNMRESSDKVFANFAPLGLTFNAAAGTFTQTRVAGRSTGDTAAPTKTTKKAGRARGINLDRDLSDSAVDILSRPTLSEGIPGEIARRKKADEDRKKREKVLSDADKRHRQRLEAEAEAGRRSQLEAARRQVLALENTYDIITDRTASFGQKLVGIFANLMQSIIDQSTPGGIGLFGGVGLLGKIFSGGLAAEGGVVRGGVPGVDSVPVLAQQGERILSVNESKLFEQMLSTMQGGGGPTNIQIQTLTVPNRAEFDRSVRDGLGPALKRLRRDGVRI